MSIWWLVFAAVALLFTQSMTAVLGVLLFILLYLANSVLSVGNFLKSSMIITLSAIFIMLALYTSDRINDYMNHMIGIIDILDTGEKLPYLMRVQSTSIYPLYDIFVKLRDFDLLPVLFGSGLGSSSMINNIYMGGEYSPSNPNAQLSRILYESGIIGFLLILAAFIHPIKRITASISYRNRSVFIIYTLLLLGSFFALRSPVIYIYTGVFIAIFKVKYRQ